MDQNIIEDENMYNHEEFESMRYKCEIVENDWKDIVNFKYKEETILNKNDVKDILDHKKKVKNKKIQDVVENNAIDSIPKLDITPKKNVVSSLERFDDIDVVMRRKKN